MAKEIKLITYPANYHSAIYRVLCMLCCITIIELNKAIWIIYTIRLFGKRKQYYVNMVQE